MQKANINPGDIIFRGQRKDKYWLFGDHLKINGVAYIFPRHPDNEPEDLCFDVDIKTVSQFTGVNDSNSIATFTLDLITFDNQIALVYFKGGAYRVRKIGEVPNSSGKLLHELKEFETIGNIFDNDNLVSEPSIYMTGIEVGKYCNKNRDCEAYFKKNQKLCCELCKVY
jgi:YopX protein